MTTKGKVGVSLAAVALIAIAASLYVANRMRPDLPAAAPLPEVALTTLQDGKPFDLGKLKGKVVVLDFWGST